MMLVSLGMDKGDCEETDRGCSSETYQLLKDAVVELLLRPPALKQMVVVVFETFPVSGKLLQAVGVDILDAEQTCQYPCPQ